MRNITNEGLQFIKGFEHLELTVYVCSAGYRTIGYGHKLVDGEDFNTITEEKAESLLDLDVAKAENSVLRFINVPLTDGQFNALVSFCFNLGGGALERSTLRQKLNREEYKAAADEFPRWIFAAGEPLRGLLRRRMAEREMFLNG